MADYTLATVIIAADAQAAAQADLPRHFTTAYTTDPTGAPPATNYVSSGFFMNDELDMVVNTALWPRVVKFGDATAALADLGLVAVVVPTEATL